MENKINLDEIFDNNEQKNQEIQMNTFKKVIDEYSDFCNVNFRDENEFDDDYQVFDCLLQLTVAKPQFFDEFHDILNKYGFNDKTYLDYVIKKITNNASNVEAFLKGLIDIGLIDDVYGLEDNSINLKSCLGLYNFWAADEYYSSNKEIISYIENGDINRNCHENALFLLKCLKTGEAITAKCSTMFNNTYYHSYYRFDGMICDLNINCIMPEESYNAIYAPKIISVVNMENLEEKQTQVKSMVNSTLVDLLEIAVYEEYYNK